MEILGLGTGAAETTAFTRRNRPERAKFPRTHRGLLGPQTLRSAKYGGKACQYVVARMPALRPFTDPAETGVFWTVFFVAGHCSGTPKTG